MIDEGILDGDFVVVEEQNEAKDGDIVVAVLDDGMATLKRYYKEATRVRLEPANSTMKPIFARKVRIKGRVRGVIRRFPRLVFIFSPNKFFFFFCYSPIKRRKTNSNDKADGNIAFYFILSAG